MNLSDVVKTINKKYYGIIQEKYGVFLRGPYSEKDLTDDVEIISVQDCFGANSDLNLKRGKCTYATGKITLRDNAFIQGNQLNEHLLVHEYIHKIACNQKKTGRHLEWGSGFDFFDKNINWSIFNELMTEWLAFNITGYHEDTPYQKYLPVIDDLQKHLCADRFGLLIKAYFTSDLNARNKWLYYSYGLDYQDKITAINKEILRHYVI